MAVNVDTVYQRVLALANKEQRGYITPQEFNLFANQAQMDIFEQYFYDLNQFRRLPGNDTEYADMVGILEEKIQVFDFTDGTAAVSNYTGAGSGGINKQLPDYIYRAHRIEYNGKECEILNTKDFTDARNLRLGGPSDERPICNIRNNILRVWTTEAVTATSVRYLRIPEKVIWGYVVINDKALYNANTSVNFALHPSEESDLVFSILQLAGINMDKELYTIAATEEKKSIQQEKM
tara:strand:+ start:210 stop:917 length:708 start_codon:yes stop_codon:yes gene_type:complete